MTDLTVSETTLIDGAWLLARSHGRPFPGREVADLLGRDYATVASYAASLDDTPPRWSRAAMARMLDLAHDAAPAATAYDAMVTAIVESYDHLLTYTPNGDQ